MEFDSLPPEVIHVHSEKSILSEEEHRYSSASEVDEDVSVSDRISFDSLRPDSADELPPPLGYLGRSAPADLLAKRTPETAPLDDPWELLDSHTQGNTQGVHDVDELDNIPLCRVDTDSQAASQSSHRSFVVDGGPPPRGFLETEVPPVREILRCGNRRLSLTSLEIAPREFDGQLSVDAEASDNKSVDEPSEAFQVDRNFTKGKQINRALRKRMKKAGVTVSSGLGARSLPTTSLAAGTSLCNPTRATTKKDLSTIAAGATSQYGKKKVKKMMERYGEQSEDEREMAIKLMGGKKMNHQIVPVTIILTCVV